MGLGQIARGDTVAGVRSGRLGRVCIAVLLIGLASGCEAAPDVVPERADAESETRDTGVSAADQTSEPGEPLSAEDPIGDLGAHGETGPWSPDIPPCETSLAVVTDIDGTLTTADAEFYAQMQDPTHDPAERAGASELINAYHDRGYFVLYLTGRGEDMELENTEETAREATLRWLVEHGFPTGEESTQLSLAPTLLPASEAIVYKAGVIGALRETGIGFSYGYTNSDSDRQAYAQVGVPLEGTFVIGDLTGTEGTAVVVGEDWLDHLTVHMPSVPDACDR